MSGLVHQKGLVSPSPILLIRENDFCQCQKRRVKLSDIVVPLEKRANVRVLCCLS